MRRARTVSNTASNTAFGQTPRNISAAPSAPTSKRGVVGESVGSSSRRVAQDVVRALAVLVLGCASAVGVVEQASAATPATVAPGITDQGYRETVKALGSDAFLGRKPGQEGAVVTLDYLEKRFKALGLAPAFNGQYRQPVPMVELTAKPIKALTLTGANGTSLELPYAEKSVYWTRRVESSEQINGSPLVFVGFGIHAPEFGWDDYQGVDMHGKTAVILINDPGYFNEYLFKGRRMTYYGRWMYKFEEAARQGATAAIIVHQTGPAAYGWEVVRNSNTGPLLEAEASNRHLDRVNLEGWMTEASAQEAFKLAGVDFKALEASAHEPHFKPVPLNLTLSAAFENTIREERSTNIVGMIKGTERPNETLLYMAHWDHFGHRVDEAGQPQIFHGAVDNGSGIGGIVEIAKAFLKQNPKPKRTVVFMALTGEEFGLLGSAYYAQNPIFPLNQTVAAFNIDAMQPQGLTHDVEVLGFGSSTLEERLGYYARLQGRTLAPDSEPEKGYYYRSDHFNLAKVGVPSLYIKPGIHSRNHSDEWVQEQLTDYLKNRYHKPADRYDESWDVAGNLEDFSLLYRVGAELSLNTDWPQWYADVAFKAAREANPPPAGAVPHTDLQPVEKR